MKKISCLIVSVIIIIMLSNISYADFIPVTKEKLEDAYENIKKDNRLNINGDITITDDTISIINDEENFTIKYDLSGNPTFWCEQEIDDSIDEDGYSYFVRSLAMPLMLGYYPVATIQGAYNEYIISIMMSLIQSGYPSNSVDHNIATDDFDQSTIMDTIKEMWKDKATKIDNDFNTYEWIIETRDLTTTSGKVISKVTINTDGDFSKMQLANSTTNDNSKSENETAETQHTSETTNNTVVIDSKKIPRSGKTTNSLTVALYGLIIISAICIGGYYFKRIKERK